MRTKQSIVYMSYSFLLIIAIASLLSFTNTSALATDEDIRPSALAGSWYPAEKEKLLEAVDGLIREAHGPNLYGELRALIIPHAGYRFSGRAAALGYSCIGEQTFDRVIILAPTHTYPFRGCSVPSYTAYRTPLGNVPLDTAACNSLRKHRLISEKKEAHIQEHSIEIHLPLLQRIRENFKLIPILVGQVSDEDIKAIAKAVKPLLNENTLLVVSSDFTHFGPRFSYQPFKDNIEKNLLSLDFGAFGHILAGDNKGFLEYKRKTGITACGAMPIAILLHALSEDTQSMLLAYYTSGHLTGDWTNSVSYAAFCFTEKRDLLNEDEQEVLLKLSRDVLDSFTKNGSEPALSFDRYNITPAMMRRAGVFVTLKKKGVLRGCIGSITGVSPIVNAVIDNTKKSAADDPRFAPVKAAEAKDLRIEISVLTPLEQIDDYQQIRLGTDGVMLVKGKNTGLYLPQVATETGWNLEQFMNSLCGKAGLPEGSHKDEEAKIYRFQVQKFREKDS